MSGLLIVLVIAAIGFVAFGLQALSRQIQRFPIDAGRPDPLIDVSSSRSVSVRPAELHQLIGIVSNSLISDASGRTELQPILDAVTRSTPVSVRPGSGRSRARRRDRIDTAIAELERQWGLAET